MRSNTGQEMEEWSSIQCGESIKQNFVALKLPPSFFFFFCLVLSAVYYVHCVTSEEDRSLEAKE